LILVYTVFIFLKRGKKTQVEIQTSLSEYGWQFGTFAILPPPKKEEEIIIIYLNNYKGKRVSEKMSTLIACLILLFNKENAAQVDLLTIANKDIYINIFLIYFNQNF
jgi:hypothetical protein